MPPPSDKPTEPRKKAAQKDEAIRKRIETELSRKRNFLTTQGQSSGKKAKSTAAKGTLAALKPTPALKVPETITVTDISQLCAAKRSDCVVVVDDEDSMIGIVTAKDLTYRVVAEGLDPRVTLARQIMTRGPFSAMDTSGATQALEIMVSKRFRHLPVCGEAGSIVGVLDIASVFHETLGNAQRRSTASENLFSAMAGVKAELGSDGSNSDMLAWAEMLREKTALPDLASIMNSRTQPATVGPKTTVREVAQLMQERDVSAVCILEEAGSAPPGTVPRPSKIAGIFTSKDIVLRVIAAGLEPSRCSVVRVMTPHPDTTQPMMSIHETVQKMYNGRYLNIPVVEEDGRLVAIVDVLTLADATQEQVKAANQDVTVPEAAAGPMWGHFFESIREDSPVPVAPGSPPFPLGMQNRQLSTRSDGSLQPSDSASMMDSGVLSTSESDVLSSSGTASTLFSNLSPAEGGVYPFKFYMPEKRTYKFKARCDDVNQLREIVTAKLMTDPFFSPDARIEGNLRPDPTDFQMSYKDDEGDEVVITSDTDVIDAVEDAQKENSGRVVLIITGGKSWTTVSAGEGEVSAAAVSTPVVTEEKPDKVSISDPVTALAPTTSPTGLSTVALAPDKADIIRDPDAPPEYTPTYEQALSPAVPPSNVAEDNIEHETAPTPKESLDQEEVGKRGSEKTLPAHTVLDVLREVNSPAARKLPVVEEQDTQEENLTSSDFPGQEEVAKDQKSEEETASDNVKDLVARLNVVFEDVVQYKRLLSCHDAGAQKLLDMFQTLLDMQGLSPKFRRNLLVATQRLSRRAGLYPACYNLEGIELEGDHPVAAGSFADIFKGRFRGQVVCLKILRVYQTTQLQLLLKQLSAEAILWGQLSHPNLLPIYGLYRYNGRLCLVAPWMDNGDVITFLQNHPDANRALLVLDIASGISYLHDKDIIHGDLKGANILVNSSRRACLADFGLSAVSDSNILHWTSHSSAGSKGGSVRWQAPELFSVETDEIVLNTKPSDVYAFSCVAYEVFTGNIPFFEHVRDHTVMLKVREGSQPSRPPPTSPAWGPWGLTEEVWTLMQRCWAVVPDERPKIDDIVTEHGSTILVDDRPLDSQGVISPAHFRDSVGGRAELLSVADVEVILNAVDSGAEISVSAPS